MDQVERPFVYPSHLERTELPIAWSKKILTLRFDVQHLNDECQNDLNVKLLEAGNSNVKCQNDTNVECQTV